MKLLILGGAGYIGGVTAQLASEAGHELTILDIDAARAHNVPTSATFIHGDIRDADLITDLFAEATFDAVLHFAGKILVSESMRLPEFYFDHNVTGALHSIDKAAKTGVKAYIFSSSAATYGEPQHVPIVETDPTRPLNPYGYSKLIVEEFLRSYELSHKLPWVALRYFNVAGAYAGVGTDYPFTSHLVPMLLERMHHKQPVDIYGDDYDTPDGTCIRDYVHVVDIAAAHLLAAEKMMAGTVLNQPINLGTATGNSVKQVIDTFNEVTEAQIPYAIKPRRAGDPARLVASNERAKELLDWQPNHNLRTAIQDHFTWYKTHHT